MSRFLQKHGICRANGAPEPQKDGRSLDPTLSDDYNAHLSLQHGIKQVETQGPYGTWTEKFRVNVWSDEALDGVAQG